MIRLAVYFCIIMTPFSCGDISYRVGAESALDAFADTDALQAGGASAGSLTGGSYRVPPFPGNYK
jgi:hypothetical protein